ncbi:MAG: hypothetical protein K0R38_2337 [Polyangiaceae bacterium]|jgi:hypothetical protein|nr:hypothetical protein [Polyangiaceae bacterium]
MMLQIGPRSRGALAAAGLLTACQLQPKPPSSGPTLARQSDKADRKAVAVTVYNQNFGVVRDTRRLKLSAGRVELSFKDVSANIQPETVRLHSATKGAVFEVLEQNYRYDLLTPAKLLEKYVGRSINVYRYNEKTGTEEKKTAEVLSVEGGVTLRIDGEVTTNFQGRFGFADVPSNLLDKPTLVWLLESDRAEQEVEVTYLTHNLNWRADYVLKLNEADTQADLQGWVTLDNRSGTSYENAALRLVAGDVNRVQPQAPEPVAYDMAMREEAAQDKPQFKEEGLFEYHLYSLERATTLLDKETKQVSLLSAESIGVSKKLVFGSEPHFYRGRYGQLAQNQKVGVFVSIDNSEKNRLGMPLPKGTVRLYKADKSGALQFVGEDAIDHTPRDEKLELKVGDAFDVVGDRVQKEWSQVGSCISESAFEVELRNHKDTEVSVEVNEPVGGDWQVLQHSQPFVKVDAGTFRFDVKVPARGASKISYRVRVRYC